MWRTTLTIVISLHLELSPHPQSTTEYPPEYTNILKPAQNGIIIGCHHNPNMYPDACSVHMVIVEDSSINYETSTLKTVSSEYNRKLQIIPKFSNLYRMGGK
jgi:hypothetical protein